MIIKNKNKKGDSRMGKIRATATQFGKIVINFQGFSFKLADIAIKKGTNQINAGAKGICKITGNRIPRNLRSI